VSTYNNYGKISEKHESLKSFGEKFKLEPKTIIRSILVRNGSQGPSWLIEFTHYGSITNK